MSSEMDFHKEFSKAVKMVEEKGKEYAQAKANSWFLQEMRKTVLAAEVQKQDVDQSFSMREMCARTSKEYLIHLEGVKAAIELEHRLEAEKCRWEFQFEAIRSLQSLEKEKMKLI